VKARPVAAALVLALVAAACADGYTQALLTRFFAASRLEDRTALGPIATVMFDPRTDGTVLDFDITSSRVQPNGEERVLVSARVHLPNGDTVHKPLVVTMRRSNPAADKSTTSRWIVVDVAGAP
jgi:hypothetical protein